MKSFLLRICCVLLSVLMFSCEKDIEPSLFAPAMKTGQAVEVYRKGATLYGNIQNPAGYKVESFGIELASFSRPGMTIEQYFATAQRFVVDSADAQGNFSVQVSGLEPGRMYLYRSFVNSGHNVVYGVDSTFQTPHNTAPIFGDMDTSEVSYTAFDISVNLLDDGGDSLQVMGYIYREAAEELAQEIVIGPEVKSVYCPGDQLDNQQFTLTINDLHAGRRYAVRAFAMADGIGYSKMMYVKTRTSDATLVSACDTSNASYNILHLKASILAENKQYPVTEVGFCYSSESSEPTVAHLTLPATLSGTDFEATLTQLISEKTYYIRAYARQSDNAYIYGEVLEYHVPYYAYYLVEFDANGGEGTMEPRIFVWGKSQKLLANAFTRDGYLFVGWDMTPDGGSFFFNDQAEVRIDGDLTLFAQWKQVKGDENGHEWVDLGLPSGTKWATCNVGSTTPEGYGDYFAWGEIEPRDKNDRYDDNTYKYSNGSSRTLTKYCTDSNYGYEGFYDGKTTLELMDDAAHMNWGGKWRMPTDEELDELKYNCIWSKTTQNGVNGYLLTSNINGQCMFLPDVDGYWTSSLGHSPVYATYLQLDNLNAHYNGGREYGKLVRAVFSDTEQPSPLFTLSFDANGGTGIMKSQFFMPSVSRVLAANNFFRWGYIFVGWNTSANGSGTAYSDQEEIILTQDLTLYAQWKEQVVSGTNNGHDYVDLGLPSGQKWATCNIGATTPEGFGDYFAWGETQPKDNYDWSTYKYCNGSSRTLTKYCTDSNYGYEGFYDGKTTLELMDDAAHVNWGGDWRMPALKDLKELEDNCVWSFLVLNGVNGFMVTSKTNGNSIFLPMAGWRSSTSDNVGTHGFCLSNTINSSRDAIYLVFIFTLKRHDWWFNYRSNGYTVRAVCP